MNRVRVVQHRPGDAVSERLFDAQAAGARLLRLAAHRLQAVSHARIRDALLDRTRDIARRDCEPVRLGKLFLEDGERFLHGYGPARAAAASASRSARRRSRSTGSPRWSSTQTRYATNPAITGATQIRTRYTQICPV